MCVSGFPPYLRFWPDPKHFIVLKEKKKGSKQKKEKKNKEKDKSAVVTKHTARFVLVDRFFFAVS